MNDGAHTEHETDSSEHETHTSEQDGWLHEYVSLGDIEQLPRTAEDHIEMLRHELARKLAAKNHADFEGVSFDGRGV